MKTFTFLSIFLLLLIIAGCDTLDSNNQDNLSEVELNISNLPALPDSMQYVGWLTLVNTDNPDTISNSYKIFSFSTDANGNFSQKSGVNFSFIHNSNSFLISEESKTKTDSTISRNRMDMYGRLLNKISNLNYIGKDSTKNPMGNLKLYIDVVK